MNDIINLNNRVTMSSFDLLKMINGVRKDFGESNVENSHFLKRVEDELGEEIGDTKTFRHPQNNMAIRYYDLTLEQCTLVGMRESKGVRRAVLAKLKELEAQPQFTIPQTLPEALKTCS